MSSNEVKLLITEGNDHITEQHYQDTDINQAVIQVREYKHYEPPKYSRIQRYDLMLVTFFIKKLIFCFFFHIYTINPLPHEMKCDDLLYSSKASYQMIFYTLLVLILLNFNTCFIKNQLVKDIQNSVYIIIDLMLELVYTIVLQISLSKGEECGDLKTLSLVWVISNYFLIGGFIIVGFILAILAIRYA